MKKLFVRIGWLIADMKWALILAYRHHKEQCASCFGMLGKNYGGFDYKKKTYYVCKECYEKQKNIK